MALDKNSSPVIDAMARQPRNGNTRQRPRPRPRLRRRWPWRRRARPRVVCRSRVPSPTPPPHPHRISGSLASRARSGSPPRGRTVGTRRPRDLLDEDIHHRPDGDAEHISPSRWGTSWAPASGQPRPAQTHRPGEHSPKLFNTNMEPWEVGKRARHLLRAPRLDRPCARRPPDPSARNFKCIVEALV